MNWIVRRPLPALALWITVSFSSVPARAQDITVSASVSTRPAISVLDSTKEQDGLVGSVRRVKTEIARIELKDGRVVEGPAQLVEVTTYGIKGNRIENTSYPTDGAVVGREEYKYDQRGNIIEMTVRNNDGAIINREAYSYEFDKVGNWTKMLTNLVVFENGELKQEPVEVTYRTLTYYFDDAVAKLLVDPKPELLQPEELKAAIAQNVPEVTNLELRDAEVLDPGAGTVWVDTLELAGEPPPLLKAITTVEAVVPLKPAVEATSNWDQRIANDLYVAGRERFDAGDAQGAIDSYLKSIKVEPGSAEVHLSLGHAYLTLEKDREALKALKESIKLDPNNAEAQYSLGFADFRLGRFRESADAFKKATVIQPRMAKAHYGLGLAYQELGMTSQMMDEYRIIESLDRSLARKFAQTFPQFNFTCRLIRGCP